ncbi:D-alanine--D-alanine ligase [Mannheimia haemolytica]
MSIKNEKIAVLFGGVSQEREVSLNSGAAVTAALKSLGYNVEGIDTKEFPIEKLKEKGFSVYLIFYTAVLAKMAYCKVR